jgi:hypothetical protein
MSRHDDRCIRAEETMCVAETGWEEECCMVAMRELRNVRLVMMREGAGTRGDAVARAQARYHNAVSWWGGHALDEDMCTNM